MHRQLVRGCVGYSSDQKQARANLQYSEIAGIVKKLVKLVFVGLIAGILAGAILMITFSGSEIVKGEAEAVKTGREQIDQIQDKVSDINKSMDKNRKLIEKVLENK